MTYEEAWKDQKKFIKGMIKSLERIEQRNQVLTDKLLTLQVVLMRMEEEGEFIEE